MASRILYVHLDSKSLNELTHYDDVVLIVKNKLDVFLALLSGR